MHPWFSIFTLCVKLALCLCVVSASAQDVRFFDCPDVRFFGPRDCAEPVPEAAILTPAPQAPPTRYDGPGVLLFPPNTLAPTTPPLMVDLLEHPTLENALRFLLWQQERQERSKLVQELLKELSARE